MRNFLYNALGRSCVIIAGIIDATTNFLVIALIKIAQLQKVAIAHATMWLLGLVDGKRVEAEKEETAQLRNTLELGLMQTAIKIKENAIEMEEWTEDHSDALNMVGVRLIEECNWEADAVHRYFKPLVESLDGLEYGE